MSTKAGQEEVKFWHDPHFSNLELLRATYITHAFSPHVHEGFAIGVIQSGAQKVAYRRANRIMPAGTVCVINPGEVHTGQAASEQGWTYRMLYPDASLLQKAASEIAGRQRDVPFFPELVIHDDFLVQQILKLHRVLEDPQSSIIERESRMLWTLAQLIAHHADDRPVIRPVGAEPNYVKSVREYLDDHYTENVSLEQLTQLVNVSPFHLLRVFRREVGFPPHIYLTQRRITVAKRLLLAGCSIVDVATQTGFVDQSHLTNRFKRIVGVTPGQYRKNSKNLQDKCLQHV